MKQRIFILAGDREYVARGVRLARKAGFKKSERVVVESVTQVGSPTDFNPGDVLFRFPGWFQHRDHASIHALVDDGELRARGVQILDVPPDPSTFGNLARLDAWLQEP